MNSRNKSCFLFLVIAGLALIPMVALGDDEPNLLTDRFSLALGTFILNSDTDVRFDGDTDEGTDINWENTFGGEDATRFRFDGYWRFAEKHKVRLIWFNSTRSGSRTLNEEIEWGGVVYPVDASLEAESKFAIYEMAYEYAFLHRDNWELAGTFGFHWTDLSFSLAGEGTIGGDEPVSEYIKKEASVGAPLPVIGIRYILAMPHHLGLDATAQFFALSIDEYDGNVQDYRVAFLWQPKKWLGFGVGFNRFTVTVDVEKDDFDGKLKWTYGGPIAFYSASF